ncbi:hypothetical protein ACLB2K_015954 [Fragaria x ananassa]
MQLKIIACEVLFLFLGEVCAKSSRFASILGLYLVREATTANLSVECLSGECQSLGEVPPRWGAILLDLAYLSSRTNPCRREAVHQTNKKNPGGSSRFTPLARSTRFTCLRSQLASLPCEVISLRFLARSSRFACLRSHLASLPRGLPRFASMRGLFLLLMDLIEMPLGLNTSRADSSLSSSSAPNHQHFGREASNDLPFGREASNDLRFGVTLELASGSLILDSVC